MPRRVFDRAWALHHRGLGLGRGLLGLAALVTFLLLGEQQAAAHGGRIQPPPPRPGDVGPKPGRPAPPVPPRPMPKPPRAPGGTPDPTPRPKPKPITPGDSVPPSGKPRAPTTPPTGGPRPSPSPTTPRTPTTKPTAPKPTGTEDPRPATRPDPLGSKNRRRPTATAYADWETWWQLNRWAFFPRRGVRWAQPEAVVTPAGSTDAPLDLEALAARRRALITRQQIVPFLLKHLDPDTRTRAEVRAASAFALAKVDQSASTVTLLLRHAEDEDAPQLVRESATLALGLLRRAENPIDGKRLDELRTRLLALLASERAPTRTRAFAAIAIGLLGDQPYGTSFSRHGRMTSQALWRQIQQRGCGRELTVAILTALGMQPHAGMSAEVKTALLRIANGRREARRNWDDVERSHALTAVVRLEGPAWQHALLRTVRNKRLSRHVQRAAFLALGARAADLTASERVDAADATLYNANCVSFSAPPELEVMMSMHPVSGATNLYQRVLWAPSYSYQLPSTSPVSIVAEDKS